MTHATPTRPIAAEVTVRGERVRFIARPGAAAGVRRLSETYVSGSVSQGSGSVSSTVVRRTEFALEGDDRVERPYTIPGHDLYLRDGNRVSVVEARRESGRPVVVSVINHSTGESVEVVAAERLAFELGLVKRTWGHGWFGLFVGVMLSGVTLGLSFVFFAWTFAADLCRSRKARQMGRTEFAPALREVRAALLDYPE